MSVFVVVEVDGAMKPYIAGDIEDAISEYQMSDGGDLDNVAGVFVYGQHEQMIATIEAHGMVEQ